MKKIFHNPSEEQVNLSTDNDLDEGSLGARLQAMLSQAAPAGQEEQVNHNSVDHIGKQGPPGPNQVMPSQVIPSAQEEQVNLRIVQHLDRDSLPRLVQEMLSLASTPAELDILLLSMLTAASACMPKLYFRYGPTSKHYFANLQAFIVAPPASGKGIAGQALRIVRVVDGCRPLIIPGNSTFPAFFTALYNQGGVGYLHESEGSVIVENASKVINGDSDLIFNDSFKLIKLKNNESFKNKIDELTNSKDFDVNNTQILTTVKQLTGGSFEINKLIQKKTLGSLPFKNNSFMIGDKIIINKNNYEIGVFNGDLGFVKHMLEDGIEVEINGEDFVIPFADLDILSLAYAITIHKSQGSEFENIIIVLSDEAPNMLQRNLLYTAITRAKKNVIILSKKGSFEKAVKNNEILERNSLLYSRIK